MKKKPNRTKTLIVCPQCAKEFEKVTGDINRANKLGLKLYCGRTCAGLARRKYIPLEEKKANKKAYDVAYREKNLERIKERKHEYFKRTYDPVKAAIERKPRIAQHIINLRNPKYRAYKKKYDKQHRAKKNFGEFWESALLVYEITDLYDNREIKKVNSLTNKSQKRKRKWQKNQNNNPNLPPLL